ncbi:haloacid dehalogenase type II [Terrabacter aerolatus]|uniref:Dehalogenase n=1 Tax=Terrabacter aerolatus TaxID=422442 RepID=A0A512D0G1_9MICO|nr:haloacid dehalogenase type II [Terrabacter aerolatus]GEO29953.1 dehalogenase [Terrabacter aerolatus]
MTSSTSPALERRPRLLVLDVNETLSDMTHLGDRFVEVGVAPYLAAPWFAGLLRDGFALTLTGHNPAFADVARSSLHTVLHDKANVEAATRHIMAGFLALPLHGDVRDGVRALTALGLRLATLSNGSAEIAESLFERGGIRDAFERVLSVEDAPAWKPAASAYAYALEECDVTAGDAMLVAVHPWDVHGAKAAGLRAAWIDRTGAPYPEAMYAADVVARSLPDLAARLEALPAAT